MAQTGKTAAQIVVEVMHEVQGIAKRERNAAQGFNFRGIDAVMNAVGPALRAAGGFIAPRIVEASHEVGQTAKGSPINITHVVVEYSVYGIEGEPVSGTVAAEAFDSGDKATAKAMSVAYRTFLLQLLCLPTDEPDPDASSYEATPAATRNWAAEADACQDRESALALYNEARSMRASAAVLDLIKAKGSSFAKA